MIGKLITPTIAKIDAARPADFLSSKAWYNEITPKYKNNKISSDVSRASHTHQAPHIGLPQAAPVISAIAVIHAPTGAIAITASSAFLSCHTSATMAAMAIEEYAPKGRE